MNRQQMNMTFARLILFFLFPVTALSAVTIETAVYPQALAVGQTGQYVVHAKNLERSDDLTLEPLRVDGLIFHPSPSRQVSTQMINFNTSREIRLTWNFTPRIEGLYTIPGQQITIGGKPVQVPPVQVRVTAQQEVLKGVFDLQVNLPQRPLYVGESIASEIALLIRSDVQAQLRSLPEKEGDGFLQTPMSNEFRTDRVRKNNYEFNRASWQILLTPIRAGEEKLRYSIGIVYEDPSAPRSRDIFGFQQGRVEELMLLSPHYSITVLDLPTQDRPASFNGAVGNYQLSAVLSDTQLRTGDPITLTITIAGSGNLDRIGQPAIEALDGWRIYQPKVETVRERPDSLNGKKIFEFILIAETTTPNRSPDVGFAYFNPDTARYVDASVPGKQVTIEQGTTGLAGSMNFTRQQNGTPSNQSLQPDQLRPPMTHPGKWSNRSEAFGSANLNSALTVNGVLAILMAVACFSLHRRERSRQNLSLQWQHHCQQSAQKFLSQAQTAAKSGAAQDFIGNAFAAVRASVANLDIKRRPIDSLVADDLIELAQNAKVNDDTIQLIRNLCVEYESIHYAGAAFDRDSLQRKSGELQAIIKHLDTIIP